MTATMTDSGAAHLIDREGISPASAVSQTSTSGQSEASSKTSISQMSTDGSHASSTTATTISPNKAARSKAPTLEDIAARLKKTTVSERSDESTENKSVNDIEARGSRLHLQGRLSSIATGSADSSVASSIMPIAVAQGDVPSAFRGRNDGLASLHQKAAHRSRSVSPVKQQKLPSGIDAGIPAKEMPSLQDIIDRMSKKGINGHSPDLQAGSSKIFEKVNGEGTVGAASRASPPERKSVLPDVKPKSSASDKISIEKGHPLQHKWTMYFDSKSWNPSTKEVSTTETPTSPSLSNSHSSTANSWEAALKMLGVYTTVENFMSIFSTLRRPSQLERNSNYHLFKDGIKPMWEDSANQNGGKWIITIRGTNPAQHQALLDRSWMWLVMALIGEELDDNDDVTGAVVSTRSKGDRIALWIRNKTDVDLVNKIGRKFVMLLDLEKEPGVSLEFTPNSLDDGNHRKLIPSKFISFNNPPAFGSPSFGQSPLPNTHSQMHNANRIQSSPSKGMMGSQSHSRIGMSRQHSSDAPFAMGMGASIGRTASPVKGLGSSQTSLGSLLAKPKISSGISPP